jgi:hypothetical protein
MPQGSRERAAIAGIKLKIFLVFERDEILHLQKSTPELF